MLVSATDCTLVIAEDVSGTFTTFNFAIVIIDSKNLHTPCKAIIFEKI